MGRPFLPSRLRVAMALAAGLSAAGPVAAQTKPRVAVIRIEFERVPEVSRVKLSERLFSGLAAAGFEVSAGDALRSALNKGPSPESCRSEGCYMDIAARLGVDYLVVATVSARQKNYDVKLGLVGGRDGRLKGQESARCELCGIEEVADKMDALASSLTGYTETRATAPSRLTVVSQPPNAAVAVDGRDAGAAPVTVELAPGPHEVVVQSAGYTVGRKSITAHAGANETVSVTLIPLGDGPGGEPRSQPGTPAAPWRLIGWSALGVGLAALAAGIFVLTLDGRQVECPTEMPGAECRQNTRLPAGALIGAGAVAAGMGGLVLYFGSASPVATAFLPLGGSVGARF